MKAVNVHVFRYAGEDGDGLIFVDDEHRVYYECRYDWHYLGTLSEFVKKIKERSKEELEELYNKGKIVFRLIKRIL